MSNHEALARAQGALAFAIAVLLSHGHAAAEVGNSLPPTTQPRTASPTESEPMTVTHWYGYQTLVSDIAATVGAAVEPSVGLLTYVLGAPIVHFAHGNFGRGFGSLGMRLGAVLLVLKTAACDDEIDPETDSGGDCLEEMVESMLLGLVLLPAPIAIDAAVLAREEKVVHPGTAFGWSITPYYERRTESGGLRFQATF